MLENYILYLEYLSVKLQKFFAEQKDYIFCKEGCAFCCKYAQYPYTKIEFELLKEGFKTLTFDIQQKVINNIKQISDRKKNILEDDNINFHYDCPFLINDRCSIYLFRGLICRQFGLMTFKSDKAKTKIPFCAYQGLNYSNVLDAENNCTSIEKFKALNLDVEPKAYNIDYSTITDEKIAEGFGFKFGECKPLIDWLEDEFENDIN